jgi:hypothetical protein
VLIRSGCFGARFGEGEPLVAEVGDDLQAAAEGFDVCHEDGHPYTLDELNWRFSKVTKRAGIGNWHGMRDVAPRSES